MRAQAPLLEAATRIQQLASERGFDGFTGTAIEDDTLVLYWHGKLPSAVAAAVSAHGRTIPITVRAAPYPASVLAAEAKRLSQLPGVNGAGALSDFSGVWVGVSDTAAARNAEKLASAVKIVPRVKGEATPLAWRWDDTEPFWGGGVVEHRSGIWPFYSYSYCTAGFAARRDSDNVEAMTLSYHCGTSQEWHTPEGGLTLGNTSSGVADVDGAYISGRDYGATVYVGPNNSSSGVAINGYVIPTEGTLVCYEGGFSGASCNSYVTTILAYEDGIGPGFWTEDAAQQAPAGQGDSGGPVLAGSTGSGLNGIGVITLGDLDTQTTCQGLGDRICSWRVFNVNLIAALVQQDLTLQSVP
ncbi:hypothetical protein RB614_24210 [Phytohabitans sp. ZYX-F-186]|uniref:Peptidase S1 domain-containing protein n=1 Tax=Phytohabitans maris TaxID=3071409 RepID=A0ABU0ZKS8_9ACTN|nr:hypothetical protein [Phytohabitans sp. ZYX-F-186]MDQ7907630.1 hypothetical protein [Phytohabitans sp. ZYX-F-186]